MKRASHINCSHAAFHAARVRGGCREGRMAQTEAAVAALVRGPIL